MVCLCFLPTTVHFVQAMQSASPPQGGAGLTFLTSRLHSFHNSVQSVRCTSWIREIQPVCVFTSSCRHDFIDLWLPVNRDPRQVLSGTWSSSVNLKVLQSISSSGRSLPLQRRRAALAGELCLWRLREDRGGSRDLLREGATDRPTCGRTDGRGQRERKQVVVCLQKWNACF